MKVLLSCVGSSDPYGKEVPSGLRTEGPILSATYALDPDCLLLFPTAGDDGTAPRVEGLRSALASTKKDIKVYEFNPTNPALVEAVLSSLGNAIHRAIEEVKRIDKNIDLHVAVASGTPAMKQAWMILYSLGHLEKATLWQSLDPTKTAPDEKHVVPVRIDLLQRPAVLDAVERFSEIYLYERAIREIEQYEKLVPREFTPYPLVFLSELFQGWVWWDEMKYSNSLERLRLMKAEMERYPLLASLSRLVERQCDVAEIVCNGCREEREREQILNLAFLAKRCNTRGELIASVALSRRVYEECLHSRARARNLTYAGLNLSELRDLLIDNGDEKVARSASYNSGVSRALGDRNRSVAGHGMAPVTQDLVVRGLNMVNATLTELLGVDQAVLESHPFAPKVMRAAVKETLRRIRSEPV